MREGFTLLEVAVALLLLSLLALFVLEPFTRAITTTQETKTLAQALIKAQDVLEDFRANPPAPTGCRPSAPLDGGLFYQVCVFTEGGLVKYEVRVYRNGELITAWVTHQ
ncbi:MAG: prepilin-type N-terminal cleavage/methylation domain-containing protein [Meiothermus sp.]|uniref:type IV pilus modification PilV family protein n=1 Tax=Meiothermus sp. TaxID=1955249 RepID=UPI0025FE489A|nr:prepilin-type N-terminal cleavage/methylation domain-containing protein [Meiothermus sp.]MCS7194507.1 prepilin-type N-terminal cleavage/methylation domain-containing protein [Meiothermus sp.]